ncbi:MAG: deoxyribose-phosphate aldolase [Desulfovibrio sp.]|jgi:deoxyribose-phosphate aldolase|nr:deoxyribose-phosphate aldolase [Desulfovibrio sp.]
MSNVLSPAAAAAFIDHTLLAPDATEEAVEALCAEAVEHGFKGVCVNPWHVPRVAARLAGQLPLAITVAGFPLGAGQTAAKALEAGLAVDQGAMEVDMVLNIGALKGGDADFVRQDIAQVVGACAGRPVKVILETCLLTDAEKELACRLCAEAGAAFVKTSTGFARSGATEADVALLRRVVGPGMGVKASGGIRTASDMLRMLAAGADRIGASAGVAIVREFAEGGSR